MNDTKPITIVMPLAGIGKSFIDARYTLPKPLVDVNGFPMIQRVIENISPSIDYKFVFILLREQYERYNYEKIFNDSTKNKYSVVLLNSLPQGAACTVLNAIDLINNDAELLLANSDQIIDIAIDDFIDFSRKSGSSASIITFEASHPKWSFVRINNGGEVIETAEKKVISSHATAGIYYFKKGSFFVKSALSMIEKDIRFNNEFYVCPSFNELILQGEKVLSFEIPRKKMHSMGTAEDYAKYLHFIEKSKFKKRIKNI